MRDESQIISTPTTAVSRDHFVELDCGVCDSTHFRIGQIDYILTGLEDGSLHLYNLSKNMGKSQVRKPATLQSNSFDCMTESNYEHQDAVVAVDCTPGNLILSAGKDGVVFLWTVNPLAMPSEDEDLLQFQAEVDLGVPLTKAKWLSESEITVSTVTGDLFVITVNKDSQGVPYLEKPQLAA